MCECGWIQLIGAFGWDWVSGILWWDSWICSYFMRCEVWIYIVSECVSPFLCLPLISFDSYVIRISYKAWKWSVHLLFYFRFLAKKPTKNTSILTLNYFLAKNTKIFSFESFQWKPDENKNIVSPILVIGECGSNVFQGYFDDAKESRVKQIPMIQE